MKKKDYIILVVSVIIGVLIKLFFPAVGGLTEAGVGMLAVFVPTIILWIGVGTGWPSFLALVALALTGVADGQTVFNYAWGNSVNTVIIPMLIIVQVMIDNHAMQHIAEWIISRRIVSGRPYVFMILLCLAITVIGTVVYPVVMCFIFLKIIDSVTESVGYTRHDKFYKALLLLTLWVTTVMDGVWPFGRPIPTVVMTFLESLGYSINIIDWMKISLPFGLICIVVALLVIRFIYRPDISKFKNFDDAAVRQKLSHERINRSGKVSTLCVVLVILSWVIPYISGLGSINTYFASIGVPACACLAVAVMCIIKGEDGKPIIELGSALAKVNWSLVVFLGAVMFFAGYIGKPEFGIVDGFNSLLSSIGGNMSPALILCVGAFVACFATNFMSNTVSATVGVSVFVPALAAIPGVGGSEIIIAAVLIGCIANCAYLTYASSPTSGVILTDKTVTIGEAFKYSLAMIVFSYILIVVFGLTLAPAFL